MESCDDIKNRSVKVARLWSKAQPVVGAMVAGAVIDFHDTEDVVSQVAETVVRKFDDYDDSRPFLPWALGIARIVVLRYYERTAGERHIYFDQQTLELLEKAQLEAAEEVPARLKVLRQCMETIRGKSRRVMEMRYAHELKPDAIAEVLQMERNAVWVMLHRVRNALRECIERKLANEV